MEWKEAVTHLPTASSSLQMAMHYVHPIKGKLQNSKNNDKNIHNPICFCVFIPHLLSASESYYKMNISAWIPHYLKLSHMYWNEILAYRNVAFYEPAQRAGVVGECCGMRWTIRQAVRVNVSITRSLTYVQIQAKWQSGSLIFRTYQCSSTNKVKNSLAF